MLCKNCESWNNCKIKRASMSSICLVLIWKHHLTFPLSTPCQNFNSFTSYLKCTHSSFGTNSPKFTSKFCHLSAFTLLVFHTRIHLKLIFLSSGWSVDLFSIPGYSEQSDVTRFAVDQNQLQVKFQLMLKYFYLKTETTFNDWKLRSNVFSWIEKQGRCI